MRRSLFGSLALCALTSLTTVARAEGEDDSKRAQTLFDQAVESARGGDYATACQQLEQSLKLHDGLGTQFHLAGCWQKLGRTASAYALFDQVANKAHELGQTEREELARARLEALLPKLSRLRIEVIKPPAHTAVFRDDQSVPESEWGKPVPVDPGTHEVRVTAEGKEPWATKIDLTDPATTVVVSVPALADSAKAAPEPEARAVVKAPVPEPTAPARAPVEVAEDGGTRRTIAIIVGGVGVAALAGGILEGAAYVHDNREAKGLCPFGINCTTEEITQHAQAVDDARTARTWSYVGIGVGSAAILTGAYLYLTAPRAPERQRAMAVTLDPLIDGRGTWGGALRGRF